MNIWAGFFIPDFAPFKPGMAHSWESFVPHFYSFILKRRHQIFLVRQNRRMLVKKKFGGSWTRTQHVSIKSRLCLPQDHHNSPSTSKLQNIRIIWSEHVYVFFFITEAKFIPSSVLKIMLDFNCSSIQHEWYHKTDQQGNAPFHPTRFVPSYSRPIKIVSLQK